MLRLSAGSFAPMRPNLGNQSRPIQGQRANHAASVWLTPTSRKTTSTTARRAALDRSAIGHHARQR